MTGIERDWLAAEQSLTSSEWEVIEGIAKGWTHARISDWLGISTKTVRVHICHISAKLPPHGGLRGYARVLYWIARQPHVKQLAA